MNLYDDLTDDIHTHNAYGNGRIFFMRHLEFIQQCLAEGYSKRRVWRKLQEMEQMPIGYEQFLNHCKRHLAQLAPGKAPPNASGWRCPFAPDAPTSEVPAPTSPPGGPAPRDALSEPRTFDPTATQKPFVRNRHALSRDELRGPLEQETTTP